MSAWPSGTKPRVVLDSNVWVSGLIKPAGPPGRLLEAVRHHQITAVVSNALVDEVLAALDRPKVRTALRGDAEGLAELLSGITRSPPTVDVLVPVRDPGDAIIVAAAVAGRALAIVTGDKDLLEDPELTAWLAKRRIEILRPAELVDRLGLRP